MSADAHSYEQYMSPLASRYASERMARIFSPAAKFRTWRQIWIALAEAQQKLGLPVTDEQLDQMRDHADHINYDRAEALEHKLRHDIMAHVHAFGEQCPAARPIIHLGATSCDVGDNADLVAIREGLGVVARRLVATIERLARFADKHKALPTLGFTHYQPAQLTTVGKRACLWLWDLVLDYEAVSAARKNLRFRGIKGTTGTQASFLRLFDGDHEKVKKLDRLVAEKLGFAGVHPVTGQTYTRKVDSQILAVLSGIAQSAHKFANDIRLLSNRKELEEPFEKEQVGSSAMAYKRNPMRSERMTALARVLISLAPAAAATAAEQWLERTLDDSAARRIVLGEGFLAADAILRLYQNIVEGLIVYPKMIGRHIAAELPFMATENVLMAAVKAGGDRQTLHEAIRRHSQDAAHRVKIEGGENDLLARLKGDRAFAKVDIDAELDPSRFVGRAPQQVAEFLAAHVRPVLEAHRGTAGVEADINV
ncbi:MAG: adenylosuccinate lyase [Planctomycetes bacterium SM23_25]|nr:MAG: adenylosuccinate lyase [Planctomycetes bacterium SM23_25]